MDYAVNPFRRPMNALQKQWYRILLARKLGFHSQNERKTSPQDTYQSKCRKRYKQAFHCYNQQFLKEIKQLEAMQPSAMDAMRLQKKYIFL